MEKKENIKTENLEENEITNKPKKIEIVNGDGNLTISPVYQHLEVEKPKPKENKIVIIPKTKKEIHNSKENNLKNISNKNIKKSKNKKKTSL